MASRALSADRAHVARDEEAKGAIKKIPDAWLVERVKLAVEGDAVDLLDRLMHEQAKEDHRRARWREVVLTKELVLPRAGLVDFQVAGETVGLLDRHTLANLEALGAEKLLLHVGPLRQSLPDGREVVLGRLVRGESTFSGREKAT